MSEQEQPVLMDRDGQVAILTLNRPDKFNCLSSGLVSGLNQALDKIEADADIRAVLIRAAGKQFCTGADLDEVLEARKSKDAVQAFISRGHMAMRRLENLPKPVIIAVHGLALAGGVELAMSGDVLFLAESGRMGDQHAQFGLIPGWGGTQRLGRHLGRRRALDLMYSARWLSSAEALDWGLANYVVADDKLWDEAMAYCQKLSLRNPEGLAMMKSLTLQGLEGTLDAGLSLEETAAADALLTANTEEGLNAFQERREPVFK
jgi:enoyl-CoA hydratase